MNDPEALAIVVGYDGTDPARRALGHVGDVGARAARVLVVTVALDVGSAGCLSEGGGGGCTADIARTGAEPSGEIARDCLVDVTHERYLLRDGAFGCPAGVGYLRSLIAGARLRVEASDRPRIVGRRLAVAAPGRRDRFLSCSM